jgi:serine/threonine protein kinase
LKDGTPALLKVPNTKHTVPAQLSRFQREYDAFQSDDIPGLIKPIALVNEDGRPAMVLEDLAGEPLESVLNRHRLDVPACLRLGSELARILAGLHAAHIIHRDIRPANFMLCMQQGMQQQQLRLLDLSLTAFDTHSGSLNRRRK